MNTLYLSIYFSIYLNFVSWHIGIDKYSLGLSHIQWAPAMQQYTICTPCTGNSFTGSLLLVQETALRTLVLLVQVTTVHHLYLLLLQVTAVHHIYSLYRKQRYTKWDPCTVTPFVLFVWWLEYTNCTHCTGNRRPPFVRLLQVKAVLLLHILSSTPPVLLIHVTAVTKSYELLRISL